MTALAKFANAYHHVSTAFMKISGVWKQVRGIYIKKNGVWVQSYGRPNIDLFSLGLEQTLQTATNKGVWVNGVHTLVGARSYSLATFDKYGNMTSGASFDIFGEDAYLTDNTQPAVTGQIDGLTNALNAMPTGQLFALTTFDEPMGGRLRNSLPAAVYRVGGTAAIYGNANFAYRSAYMLVGKVGSAPYLEANNGKEYTSPDGVTRGDPNSAIAVPLSIFENNWVAS